MGLRFSRRMTLFPGVRLNFSARGMSVTVGPRGASVNIGPDGTALNLGIPGTGLSYRHRLGGGSNGLPGGSPNNVPGGPLPEVTPVTSIQSAPVSEVTSEGLQAMKELVLEARSARSRLKEAISTAALDLAAAEARLRRARGWFFGLFLKKKIPERQAAVEAKTAELNALRTELEGTYIDADWGLDEEARLALDALGRAFTDAASCARIWDVTSSRSNDRVRTRSYASTSVERFTVRYSVIEQDEVLETGAPVLRLQNANGSDLDLYPGFLLMQSRGDIALVDLRELSVNYSQTRFVETDGVPSDSIVVDHTWAKCNKDGSRDKRFAGNYQIPVALYGEVTLSTPGGLHEEYQFSSAEKAQAFASALKSYQSALKKLGIPSGGKVSASPSRQEPRLPAPPPEASRGSGPVDFKATTFLSTTRATAVDSGSEAMIRFANLLAEDLQQLNGRSADLSSWREFLRRCETVMPTVLDFFDRSPGARGLEAAAVAQVRKMLQDALKQIQTALEPEAAADLNKRALLEATRQAAATIAE